MFTLSSLRRLARLPLFRPCESTRNSYHGGLAILLISPFTAKEESFFLYTRTHHAVLIAVSTFAVPFLPFIPLFMLVGLAESYCVSSELRVFI